MPPLTDTFPEFGPVFGPIAAELWRLFGPTVHLFLQWSVLCGVPPIGPITINLTPLATFFYRLYVAFLACAGAAFAAVAVAVGIVIYRVVRRTGRGA